MSGLKEFVQKDIASISPLSIDHHWRKNSSGFGDLSLKEMTTYLGILLPAPFDDNAHVSFGDGAKNGSKLVLGAKACKDRGFQGATCDLLARIPHRSKEAIWSDLKPRLDALPSKLQQLPGYARRLQGGPATCVSVLDLEIAFCWFQGWLATKEKGQEYPLKWKAFLLESWADVFPELVWVLLRPERVLSRRPRNQPDTPAVAQLLGDRLVQHAAGCTLRAFNKYGQPLFR